MPRDHTHRLQTAAKTYLEMRGYDIIEQSWHQSRYTVDIIAKKDDVVYFVNVKNVHSNNQETAADAVTASKIKQLQQAALSWVGEYKWLGQYRLSTVDIDSANLAVLGFIDNEL
jgi:Holliday junction resolvase-like predicted endonuclease